MKKGLLLICSILLVLTCVFGLLSCLAGLGDIKNIQDYKLADSAEATAGLEQAREGIELLGENELTYIDGVAAFEDGQVALVDGQKQLESGAAALHAGEAAVAEGQAQIDANTQAYNEGKAQLAKIQPLMPYLNMYVTFRNNNLTGIAGFSDAQSWFNSVVIPIANNNGLEVPPNVEDFPAYIQGMVADGEAQIKQYEDGLAALNAGKSDLASGYADYAAGQQELEDGKKQLEEGDMQLKEYEEGQAALADGMNQLLEGMTTSQTRSGKQTVPSLAEMLGEDWSVYKLDENGKPVQYRGCDFVDIDACSTLCDTAEEYMKLSEADVTAELYSRVATYAVAAVACVLGLIAGIFGIIAALKRSAKTGSLLGILCAAFAVIANIIGVFTGYTNYIYGTRDADKVITYSGDMQFVALIALAVVAIIFALVSTAAKKKAKRYQKMRQHMM